MKAFEELLQESVRLHGHLCPGQILGVRMAMAGCREIGICEPDRGKNLIAYVEIDRCAADAIQSVTGCKLGKRTLKYVDYGKMAATFLNTETGQAVRVLVLDETRQRAHSYATPGDDQKEAQLEAYRVMPEEELLLITPVRLRVAEEDLPGRPTRRVACNECGEGINDRREVQREGRVLCRACAFGAYYERVAIKASRKPAVTISSLVRGGLSR